VQPTVSLEWAHEINEGDVGHIEVLRAGIDAGGVALPSQTFTIASKSALAFVDRDVVVGATYTYKVLIEDAQGGRGEWSEPVSCVVPDPGAGTVPEPPPYPVNVSVSGRSVTLTWSPSPSKETVDEYRVYRDVGLTVPIARVPAGDGTSSAYSYTDPTVEYGGSYTYFVTAVWYGTVGDVDVVDVLWESVSRSSGLVQIPQPPVLSMRITIAVDPALPSNATRPTYARMVIHSLDTGAMIPANPWEYPTLKFVGNQKVWDTAASKPFRADLYQGSYEVIGMFYSQTNQRLGTWTEPVELMSLATPVTVIYRGTN
jgi:hypothetical protein